MWKWLDLDYLIFTRLLHRRYHYYVVALVDSELIAGYVDVDQSILNTRNFPAFMDLLRKDLATEKDIHIMNVIPLIDWGTPRK